MPLPRRCRVAPRAVLFDLDGTLLDSKLSIRDTMNTVLKEWRLPLFTAAELDREIGKPLRDILATKFPATPDPAILESMALRYREAYGESGWFTVQVYPGLEALLGLLRARGVRLGVVTSKGEAEAEKVLLDLGIAHLLDTVVGDDDARPLKPDPAPVLEACRRLGVEPAQAVMVGDTIYDAKAALAADCPFIGVLWGIQDRPTMAAVGATWFARDAYELERLLGQM